jgi:uncharacterized integral membrane protein (TIGR00698 family)
MFIARVRPVLLRHHPRRHFFGSRNNLTSVPVRYFSAVSTDEKKETKPPPTTSESPSLVPGIALSAATAAAGFQVASVLTSAIGVPVSGIPLSILLGMGIKNTVGYSDSFQHGVKFSTKTILQGGIVAVAAKLSFVELLTTGSQGLPVVIAAVGAGLVFIPMAGRLAGLPKEMTLLLTAGTSICGVTAITALAPAIKASNRDIAVAVANTVLFGTVGMLTYPYLFNVLCSSSEQVGMCLGVAIHDTSQVLGSAMAYKEMFNDEIALKVAAITKLTRNLGLAIAIPGLTYFHALEKKKETDLPNQELGDTISGLQTFQKYVPTFLIAFVGMSSLRSCGDFFLGQDAEIFQQTMSFIGSDLSKYALGTAMAGVGLSTSTSSLKGVGWKPFAVGASGALVVGGTGFTVASMLV